jgi:hypothetical protein
MKSLTKEVIVLSSSLFLSSPIFATQILPPELFIPEKMHIKLIGGGENYTAKIDFEYNGNEKIFKYHIKTNWQFIFDGDFDLTKFLPSNPNEDPSSELFIPEKIHLELRGSGETYTAKLEFEYNGKERIFDYHIDPNLQHILHGDFDLTKYQNQ